LPIPPGFRPAISVLTRIATASEKRQAVMPAQWQIDWLVLQVISELGCQRSCPEVADADVSKRFLSISVRTRVMLVDAVKTCSGRPSLD